MQYRYFVDFPLGILVFANFSYGIAVLGTPQRSPNRKLFHFIQLWIIIRNNCFISVRVLVSWECSDQFGMACYFYHFGYFLQVILPPVLARVP